MTEPRWTIDVCVSCGRQAKWPFCEHRPAPNDPHHNGSATTVPLWCVPVVVKPAYPAQYRKAVGTDG
jgi:hypothetical protein